MFKVQYKVRGNDVKFETEMYNNIVEAEYHLRNISGFCEVHNAEIVVCDEVYDKDEE